MNVRHVTITPGQRGYEVQISSDGDRGYAYHYVSDMFDLHQTLDRLFPPQKPEAQSEAGK